MAELAGTLVVVTRPAQQAEALVELIEAGGGHAIRFPVIEIRPPTDPAAAAAVIERLDRFQLAVFVSPNAVRYGLALARPAGPPAGLELAAVGAGTARALAAAGFPNAVAPPAGGESEALLALPRLHQVRGQRVVIFRGEGGRELLRETLAARGAEVEVIECYRRLRPACDTTRLREHHRRGELDIITITSSDGLRNLVAMTAKADRQWLFDMPLALLHPRIEDACRDCGWRGPVTIAAATNNAALVEAVARWRAGR